MLRAIGKIALVTGGAQGIGEAIAIRLSAEGATVIVTDVNAETGSKTAAAIGRGAHFLEQDVTSEAQWKKVIGEIETRFDRIDILVNNAGISNTADIEESTHDLWKKTMAINADSVFLGCKYGVASMKNTGGGVIVNIASMVAQRTAPYLVCYAASKAAVTSMTKSVALHCAANKYNIRCNSVLPGAVKTPMYEKLSALAPDRQAYEAMITANHPLGRIADPVDIANAVLFLASDEAGFITGAALPVDGGFTAA